ncbi:MAG TPA: YceH family protein [Burkholderiaceae bacterium]|nr:YceH family protein [Burkholderiaceae bacterium]
MRSSLPLLSLLETRVLGVLVEKERTVSDTYPLSLNSLASGCNQKSNRDPVIEATEAEVQAAVDALKALVLVIESSGARVARYSHNIGRVLRIPDQAVALLAGLMLRGAQTSAELRTGTERLHRFADISSVDAFLDELAARAEEQGGALVKKLGRRPGEREARWMHCLSGPPVDAGAVAAAFEPSGTADVSVAEIAALKAHVGRLEHEVAQLRDRFDKLTRELGVST